MLMIIGGFLMMLQPLLVGKPEEPSVVGYALREAFPPHLAVPSDLVELTRRIH